MTVKEAIKKRRSIRKYKAGAEVSDETVKELLEAAMLAPSACNMRPVEFLVVRNREKLEEIMKMHPHTGMLKTASLAIIVLADVNKQADMAKGMYIQDCSAYTQNILLQAAELELGTCWCGVAPNTSRMEEMRKIFGLAENIEPFSIIAVGVPDESFGSRGFYEEAKVTWVN